MLHIYSFKNRDSFETTGLDRFKTQIDKAIAKSDFGALYPIKNQLEAMKGANPALGAQGADRLIAMIDEHVPFVLP